MDTTYFWVFTLVVSVFILVTFIVRGLRQKAGALRLYDESLLGQFALFISLNNLVPRLKVAWLVGMSLILLRVSWTLVRQLARKKAK